MEIKNLHTIPDGKQGRYLDKVEKAAHGESEFRIKLIEGKTNKADIAAFLDVARGSKAYQKHQERYQFRVKSDDQGNQFLTLKQQGMWSRFKGIFGLGSAQRGQERAEAIRQIDRLLGVPANGASSARASIEILIGEADQSAFIPSESAVQKGQKSVAYHDAIEYQQNLMRHHEYSQQEDAYNTVADMIKSLYGDRGLTIFKNALKDPEDADLLNIDPKDVKLAIGVVEREMATLFSKMQDLPKVSDESVRKELKETWEGAKAYGFDREGFSQQYATLFPTQVLVDLERSTVGIDKSGALTIRNGAITASGQALNKRCETAVSFFEKGSGISRDKPEFQNMFRNFIQNFHQGNSAGLLISVGKQQMQLGLSARELELNGNKYNATTTIRFDGGNIDWDFSQNSQGTFLTNKNPLIASTREHVRVPVDSFKKPSKEFDISAEARAAERSVTIARDLSEQPSEVFKSVKSGLIQAWNSVGVDGTTEHDQVNNVRHQYPVQTPFHKDGIVRGQLSLTNGNLNINMESQQSEDRLSLNARAYEVFLTSIFGDGTTDQIKGASINLTKFLSQASIADAAVVFESVAQSAYESDGTRAGWVYATPHETRFNFTVGLSEDQQSLLVTQNFRANGFVITPESMEHPDFGTKQIVEKPYQDTVVFAIPMTGSIVGDSFDPNSIRIISVDRQFTK